MDKSKNKLGESDDRIGRSNQKRTKKRRAAKNSRDNDFLSESFPLRDKVCDMLLIDGSESSPEISKKKKKSKYAETYDSGIESTKMTSEQKKRKHAKRDSGGCASLRDDFTEMDKSCVSREHDLIEIASERKKNKHYKSDKSAITDLTEDFLEMDKSHVSRARRHELIEEVRKRKRKIHKNGTVNLPEDFSEIRGCGLTGMASEQKKKKQAKRIENGTAILSDSFPETGVNNKHSEMNSEQKKKQRVSKKKNKLASKSEDFLEIGDVYARSNENSSTAEVRKRKKKNKHTEKERNVTESLPEKFLKLDKRHDISNEPGINVDTNNHKMENKKHCRNDNNIIEIVPEIKFSKMSRKKNKKKCARKDIHPVENLPNILEAQNTNDNQDESRVHTSKAEFRMMDNEKESKEMTRDADSRQSENEEPDNKLQNSYSENEEDSEEESDMESEEDSSESDTGESALRFAVNFINPAIRKLHRQSTKSINIELDDEDNRKLSELCIVINWELPLLHQQTTLTIIKADEKKLYEDEGVFIKYGQWSYGEMALLCKNLENFKKEYDLKNPIALLGIQKHAGTRSKDGMYMSRTMRFVKYLGRGLDNRPLHSIYQRARHFFQPKGYQGRFTKHERKTLLRLVAKYGCKWKEISQFMDRNEFDLSNCYRYHDKRYNKGPWSLSEDKRLICALQVMTGEKNLDKIHHGLPWTKISQLVRTRHHYQCLKRWKFAVSYAMSSTYNMARIWKRKDDIKLLKILHDFSYQTEFDIPWDSIYEQFGLTNCFQLKKRWARLKLYAPNYYISSYPDNLDWLVNNHLPDLERKEKQSIARQIALEEKIKRAEMHKDKIAKS